MHQLNDRTKACIVGEPADIHVCQLASAVDDAGGLPVVVDSQLVKNNIWQAGFEHSVAHFGGCRGIIRGLPQPCDLSQEPAEVTAWMDLVEGIASDPGINWLTSLHHLRRADNKLYQLRLAERLGIPFPPTCISLHRDLLVEKLGNKVILKPLGSGVVPATDGQDFVFYCTLVDLNSLPAENFTVAPVMAQQDIEAAEHFRIVTVGDEAWGASLQGHSEYLDWREMPAQLKCWTIDRMPGKILDYAICLARAAEVGFSSQDWLRCGDQIYFLDLNPVGRWLFLPQPIAGAITEAIAGWLTFQRSQIDICGPNS